MAGGLAGYELCRTECKFSNLEFRVSKIYHVPSSDTGPEIAVEAGGSGPFIIFMHGQGGNKSNWTEQLQGFSASFCAAAWDGRGYGDSGDTGASFQFDAFVDDLMRVLDYFGVHKAHLAGLSMGGRVALRAALLHPDRVATLLLLDTHEGFEGFSPEQRRNFIASRRDPLIRDGKEMADIAPAVARKLLGPKATPEQTQRLIASMAGIRKDAYVRSLEATVDQVDLGDISQIRVPTHFFVGQDDLLTPPADHYEMARKITDAKVTVIPDAGHLSNIENAPFFNREALAWLQPLAGLADAPNRG